MTTVQATGARVTGRDAAGLLKAILEEVRSGEPSAALAERARDLIRSVDAATLPAIERELAALGLTKSVPPLHPVHTLMEEHRFILRSVHALEELLVRLEGATSFQAMGEDRELLRRIAHHLADAENHHQREEDALFPRMERRGVREPSAMMREDHVELRAAKKRLYQLAYGDEGMRFPSFKAETLIVGGLIVRRLASHIFKEDNIVYQIALELLSDAEWDEVKRECDSIGYCCFKPADQGGAGGEPAPAEETAVPRVIAVDMREVPMLRRLDTILKAWKELELGDAIRLTNDREPAPLQVLFRTRERGRFDWSYEKEGPTEWVAVIRRKR